MIYDGLDRLTWADAPGVLGSAQYTYDPLDNLRQIDFAGGARAPQTDVYRYNANNRLYEIYRTNGQQNQTVPYHHDVRGNMTLRGVGGHSHSYDRANRMLTANTGASTETYRYDGHGRRTTIIKSGQLGQSTQFYSRGGQLIYDRAPSGTVTRHVYLGNRLVATVTAGTISQHTDTLGSIVRRTNLIRGTVGTTVYEPYGSLGVGTTYEQRPGFTGHMTDAATTLSYMQQRYYDSTAMRFLSVDPVAVSTTDGSNFNRYWYANNNPYKYVDPDGREAGATYKLLTEMESGVAPGGTSSEVAVGVIADAVVAIAIDAALGGPSGEGAAIFAAKQTARVADKASDAKPLLGRNAQPGGSRTNTDAGPNGDRATAKSVFRNQAEGKRETTTMANGGTRTRAENGVQIRQYPDGSSRVDMPGRGSAPNGESLHTPAPKTEDIRSR
jgi:RHS repeat-associated protein